MPRGYGLGEFYWFMEKRKQASRTPNASRNTTSQSMSERQGVRGLPNLAAAFGVREACFRFGLSHWKAGKLLCFGFNANGPGAGPISARSKIEMLTGPGSFDKPD